MLLRFVLAPSVLLALACRPLPATSPAAVVAPVSLVPAPAVAAPNAPAPRTAGRVLFQGARVMTAAGIIYERGDVLVSGARIERVAAAIPVTPDMEVLRLEGRTITPGLIDTHSHLGVYPAPRFKAHDDGNEMTSPITADLAAADGYWPLDPQLRHARAAGVTTLQILPGSANLIGGRSFVAKTYPWARSAEDARFRGAPEGLKMACGENPKRVYGEKGGPQTRMGSVARLRKAFEDARDYRTKWSRYRQKERESKVTVATRDGLAAPAAPPPEPPARDPVLETLVRVLEGKTLVHHHCYRADEMSLMLELAASFGYRIRSFHHAVEAYKIADRLAAANVSSSVWADWWGFKAESYDGIRENAALLSAAGARAIIHSDSPYGIQHLHHEAAKAMRAGQRAGLSIDDDEALRWITHHPAWALGVDHLVGTLEPGKLADLVVWTGSPFSVHTQVDRVYLEGTQVFDRSSPSAWDTSDFELGQVPPVPERATPSPARATTSTTRATPKPKPGASTRPNRLSFDLASGGRPVYLAGGQIHLGDGTVIERGVVRFSGPRIDAVFAGDVPRDLPRDAVVVDVSGKRVLPGLIASHTALGLVEIDGEPSTNDQQRMGSDPVRAAHDAALAFRSDSTLITVSAADGVTTVASTPTGGLIAGQVAWVDLLGAAPGRAVAIPRVAVAAALGQHVGGSRAATLARLSELLDDALVLRTKGGAFERRSLRELGAHHLDLKALGRVLGPDVPLVVQAHGIDDLLALLELKKRYGFRLTVVGAAQAYRVADELARAQVTVILQPSKNLPASLDTLGSRPDAAARLHDAGVALAIAVLDDHHNVRNLTQEAGLAITHGLPYEAAVQAVTWGPAHAYGNDDLYGSIAAGKVANLTVWDTDPFELGSVPSSVYIRGERVSTVTRPELLRERYRDLRGFRAPPSRLSPPSPG